MNYASRSSRLLGQFLDWLIAVVPIGVVMLLVTRADRVDSPWPMLAGGWALVYYFLADGLPNGGSVGKRWLGMSVIDPDSGNPCTYGQSFVRNLLLTMLGPIDWIFIFGHRHQRLGDKLANTVVVSTR